MRFPRLSYIFHRRAKSDSALAGLIPEPMSMLTTRPASANGLDELVLAEPSATDVFTPYLPCVPASITHPLPSSVLVTYPTHASRPPPKMLPELRERIRELEAALEHQYKATRRIPALEGALKTEREALRAAKQANEKMNADAAALRTNLIQTQRSLSLALTHPGADDRARVLAAENAALSAERLRHRKFIELMIAVGGHKPVLERAYKALSDGTDPEIALVHAIREALTKPGSAWATLLEPIFGPRSPAEYAAQVRLTLGARKDAKEWRKRAKFWKSRAREEGAHANTITPSPSSISSIVEVLSEERKLALNALMERRRSSLLLGQTSGQDDVEGALSDDFEAASWGGLDIAKDTLPISTLPSALATLASSFAFSEAGENLAASTSITEIRHASPTALIPASSSASSAYANLPPLASEVFRATHSIAASHRSSASSLSASVSRTLSLYGHLGRTSITASSSSSSSGSNTSAKLKRRRMEAINNTQNRNGSQEEHPDHAASDNSVGGLSSAASTPARFGCVEREPAPEELPSSTTDSDSSASGSCSSASSSTSSELRSPSPTPQRICHTRKERILVTDPNSAENLDEELVIIMYGDAAGVPRNTPKTGAPFSLEFPPTSGRSRTPSPEKSRLPVLKKAIRRISISRPVLVDTTNAATFTFSTATVKEKAVAANPGPKSKVSARLNIVGEHKEKECVSAAAKGGSRAASPPRPTKIPMGRRIQQMPADLVGTAKRAVQTKTRMKNGSV